MKALISPDSRHTHSRQIRTHLKCYVYDYLDIQFNKKPATDGHKYKSLGNSMAIPVMAYLGRSIQKALDYQQDSLDLI